jgi:hypothetical protein
VGTRLYRLLAEKREDLALEIVRRLRSSGTLHHRELAADNLEERANGLVLSLLRSLKEKPREFSSYVEQIAEERISEGFFLHEMQIALQILEERAWKVVADQAVPADQIGFLGCITRTIGGAKDQLAHVYLQQLERAEVKAALLQQRLDRLSSGTDPGRVLEEEK